MKFNYVGIDLATDEQVHGEIDAVSDVDAARELRSRNIEAIKVTPFEDKNQGKKRVTVADLVLPLQELATLIESGVALVEAVNALAKNKEHAGLSRGFKKIASLIESGESFSQAISESLLPFPAYVKHLVSAGELSGELGLALRNASNQMNYDQTIVSDIKNALTYPLLLIGSGIAATLIIFFAVVPKFTHMLEGTTELPTLAWLVLSAGKIANDHTLLVLGGATLLVLAVIMIFANQAVRTALLNFALDVPVVGPWLAEQDAARWAALSGAMLGARVNLVTALTLAAESSMFVRRQHRAMKVVNDVQTGMSLTESVERASLLPASSINLVAVGDKTGQLDTMLSAVAKLHDESCKRRMKRALALIEPIAILIVGVLIGIMIMGIVMAITASTDIAI